MKQISRDELKKKGFKRFIKSFKNSVDGLAYAYKNEQSLWIHGISSVVCIALGLIFHIRFYEWSIVLLTLGLTLGMELVNTAIEAAVDLVTLEIHPLAKIAKDCGSAATFVCSMIAIAANLFVFGPYIYDVIIKLF